MPKFIMCIGPSRSGKTTWAENMKIEFPNKKITIVSRDKVKEECRPSSHEELLNIMISTTLSSLKKGYTVILDSLNLSYLDRRAFLSKIPFDIPKEARIFAVSIWTLCRRALLKRPKTKKDIPTNHILNFDMPLYSEGFTNITINPDFCNTSLSTLLNKSMNFYEGMSNSTSLGEHLIKTQEKLKISNRILKMAAGAHDLGKLYIPQTYDKKNLSITHEKIGAYLVCSAKDIPKKYKVEVAQLVALHTRPALVKSREEEFELWCLAGDRLYGMLSELYAADKAARAIK